jgi:D-ribose pyranase
MKKSALINSEISHVIASLGPTDMLVVADARLPIPSDAQRIDLALTRGIPAFPDTLRVVLQEMHVEQAVISEDVMTVSPKMYETICSLLESVPVKPIPHEEFKKMTASAKAIVRTGEFTPYANVILVAGAWGFGL